MWALLEKLQGVRVREAWPYERKEPLIFKKTVEPLYNDPPLSVPLYLMATSQSPKIFLNHLPPVLPSMPPSEIPNMPNITIDCNGVVKLLGQLNPSKANGPDQIPTRVLKEAAPAIAPYLYYIFQQSLDSGDVPADHDWRHANIFAIYKKGSRVGAANYRPISLTSVPCKIMEHSVTTSWSTLIDMTS